MKKQYDALQSKVEENERTNKALTESINRQNEELSRVKKESDRASYRRNLDRKIAESIDAEALLKKSPETLTSSDLLQLIAKCRDLIAKNVKLNYDSKMARQEKDSLQLKFDKLNRAWHSPKELRLRLSHYSDYTEEVLECLEERFGCAIDEEWLKIIETREGLACFATIPKAGGETIRVAITPQKEMRATSYTIVKTYDDAVRWWKQPQIWSFDTTLRSVKDAKSAREYWNKQESEHPSEQSTGLRIRR